MKTRAKDVKQSIVMRTRFQFRNAMTKCFSFDLFSGPQNKRQFKDKKFGFGGKKKGGKANTKQSTDDVSGYKPFRANNKKVGKMAGKPKRAGKARRQKMKSKKK